MKTSRAKLAGLIAGKTVDGSFTHKDAREIAALVLRENRTGEISSLLRDVARAWMRSGIVEVVATCAHELTPAVEHEIQDEVRRCLPDSSRVIVTPKFDETAIGGVKLAFGDYNLDLSIEGKLQKFRTLAVRGKE
jgi:F0F1-type ATP synthase delta subunit